TALPRRLLDADLGEDTQQMRILTLQDRELLGGAFDKDEQVAAAEVGTQERGDPLAVVLALADLDQFQQVAHVQDGLRLARLAPEVLTALLPHAEARHPGDKTRAARRPEGRVAKPKVAPTPYQFVNDGCLADAGRPDQQDAPRVAA